MPTYLLPGGMRVVVDAQGNAYMYASSENNAPIVGRYMVGRPDLSTISDPLGAGGAVYTVMQMQNKGGGGAAPQATKQGTAPPEPVPGQQNFGAALDAWLNWQVQNSKMSSAEARKAQKSADAANRAAQAKQDAYYAEQEKRYKEDKAHQAKLEAEAKKRNQYYNVQESIQQGLQNAQMMLPTYMPNTVQSALSKWAGQLGQGFNASMPITPDPQAFLNYLISKGYPSNLVTAGGG